MYTDDADIIDDKTMHAVAKKSGKRLAELVRQLQAEVDDKDDDPVKQALQMLKKWKQTFNGDNPVKTLWKAALSVDLDLSKELGPLQQNPPCPCGNNDPMEFRRYFSDREHGQSRFIGICCASCGQEWLQDKFSFHPDVQNTHPEVKLDGVVLKIQLKVPIEKSPASQGNVAQQKIELHHALDDLKVGDHIAWERPYVIWHHAIVSGVNKDKGVIEAKDAVIEVIHWSKIKLRCGTKQIMREEINLAKQQGQLYLLKYGEETTNANPVELVIARAKSRVGDNEYSLDSDNCESFASHCKCGVAETLQIKWFYDSVKKVAIDALVCAALVTKDINIEEVVHGAVLREHTLPLKRLLQSKQTGACIIIVIGGFKCVLNLAKSYKKRVQGDLSLEEFTQIATRHVVEALVLAGLATWLSADGNVIKAWLRNAVCSFIFPVGTVIEGFVVNSFSLIAAKTTSSYIGPLIGRAFARAIGTDDRAVYIEDVNPGDQIVLQGKLLHPRHHAIVVSCDPKRKKVKVVHNTYQNGIVEDEVDFVDPVYRVMYNDQYCFPPDEVIKRARSKVVPNVYSYSLVSFNCKHFAQWCKLKFNQ